MQLIDTFGRVHNYLRLSLTQHCNFRCTYCMPEKHAVFPAKGITSAGKIAAFAKKFYHHNATKIMLTDSSFITDKRFSNPFVKK